ncbi:tetratricopeptide repeat protein [Flavobacterium sp. FlaQc-48]|uniref:tetratricopeptide repeat protein n=1 Tax=Flavobacterium sp. FlaQc-48 TaxID=3374181 RepID=UPI003757C28A
MKNIILIITVFTTFYCVGQDKLNFNTKFIQSEDKWIAFPVDSSGSYIFGFIYIDSQAGLTFDYSGSFKIDSNGKFLLKKKDKESSVKHRLKPNKTLVAIIPESHFTELEVSEFPEWLKYYKQDENTIERLYKLGYLYNGWEECAKALDFLDKAKKINPNYKGLKVELAFSYNCLGRYQNAIDILKTAIKLEPNNAYVFKELIYSQIHNNQLDDAITTYDRIVKELTDKTYNPENAYNILGEYFRQKNLIKFNQWISKTQIDKDKRFGPYVEKLKEELDKK